MQLIVLSRTKLEGSGISACRKLTALLLALVFFLDGSSFLFQHECVVRAQRLSTVEPDEASTTSPQDVGQPPLIPVAIPPEGKCSPCSGMFLS